MHTYFDLAARLRDIATLNSVGGLLGWDENVMLPPAGTAFRAEQAAMIARLSHEQTTSASTHDILSDVEASDLDDDQAVVVREFRRDLDRATKLPTALVTELSKTTVFSQAAWVDARERKDFAAFAPWLEKVVALKREEAACYGADSGDPYDALLDTFEPGETVATLRPTFAALVPALVDLLGRVKASGRHAPTHLLRRPLPVDRQRAMTADVAARVGFDTTAGRLDVSVHPFCSGIAPGDTRITTRYAEDDFLGALLGTLHETGHAMYEQGLPKAAAFGTTLAEAASLGIHESQSRLWENQVGRGQAFWTHVWPTMQRHFGDAVADIKADDWLFAMNAVGPSFIRTEADELTYNLHVALRFDLEHALVNGAMAVRDVPGEWNRRMKSDLGLDVPDDAMGCLQDVHWGCGLIGYFPTYTLGNLYAAAFFEAADAAMPGLQDDLAAGRFDGLLNWLRDNVHRHGRRYRAGELCQRVTGRPRSADALLRRLTQKVERYYGVKNTA